MITKREVKRNGPRKWKSQPFLAAQNVYSVEEMTTILVRIPASKMTLPVKIMSNV